MIINILNTSLFNSLERHNQVIATAVEGFKFNSEYNLAQEIISPWFDPKNVKDLGLSRTYPHMSKEQYRPEYCLTLHCSNYLGLFLINRLYENKNTLIEDIGGGMGWWFVYLHKLGFNNFSLIDNFSQLSETAALKFKEIVKVPITINNFGLKPVVTQNVGVPALLNRGVQENLELIICYTNRALESAAERTLPELGYTFLCKDTDDLAFAYCRNDKYEEFTNKLKEYEV